MALNDAMGRSQHTRTAGSWQTRFRHRHGIETFDGQKMLVYGKVERRSDSACVIALVAFRSGRNTMHRRKTAVTCQGRRDD